DGTLAVPDLNLEVADGELMVLVGPSGCGKTSALRMVAGLEEITSGEITIGEDVVNGLPPRERDVAMVFQNYALYPHKSVYDNLAFPLKLRKMPKAAIDERVRRIARLLELEDNLDRKPRRLSGGQRQRVAMGRAIVREPEAFLMDEPLSNLDAKLRTQMRAEIGQIHRDLGVTMIYVTHDQVEAMTLGQRVAVMRKGALQQVGSPRGLYSKPQNLFVAGFIGSPSMNFVDAEIESAADGVDVVFGSERLVVDSEERRLRPALAARAGRHIILGIRPQSLVDAAQAASPPERRFRGLVRLTEDLGSEVVVHFDVEATPAVTEEVREIAQDVDQAALDVLERERALQRTPFAARFPATTRARPDQTIEVCASPGSLYFFDPDTGESIEG
ncbi:MAG: ABC transporter ATP-binding protein, partial [Gaiellales bacterium]